MCIHCVSGKRGWRSLLLACVAGVAAGCGAAPVEPGAAAPPASLGQPADASAAAPPEAVRQFEQAIAQLDAGDVQSAEQGFRTLSQAYPTYSGPLLNLGILHARAGRLPQAEQALRAALERNSDNAPVFNQLGILYRKLGRFDEADQAYQRALQIDPNYAIAYLNLGVLCDLYLQQPQRALEAYQRYLVLAATPDAGVNAWVRELKSRLAARPRAAGEQEEAGA